MRGKLLLLFVVIAASLVACGGGAKRIPVTTPVPVEPPREPVQPVEVPVETPEVQVSLATIYFDFDRSDIRANQRGPLAENAKAIETDPGILRIIIEGHCDERGTNEYNMALGQRRADSVKSYLVNYGIPQTKLSTVSYGEGRPVDPGHSEEAWARNRRAEFVVQK